MFVIFGYVYLDLQACHSMLFVRSSVAAPIETPHDPVRMDHPMHLPTDGYQLHPLWVVYIETRRAHSISTTNTIHPSQNIRSSSPRTQILSFHSILVVVAEVMCQ